MEGNNKQKEKEISLDDLAQMVQKGFNEMGERIENRLDGIDGKLLNIEANLNKKIDRFEHKELEIRVEKMEEKLQLKPKLKFA